LLSGKNATFHPGIGWWSIYLVTLAVGELLHSRNIFSKITVISSFCFPSVESWRFQARSIMINSKSYTACHLIDNCRGWWKLQSWNSC
jgi:hypothetical protein